MPPPSIVLIGGGTRSGKSALALELARQLGSRRAFVATARAYVTNEVGMSVHPETPLGRAFVEVSGFANQRLARAADDIHLAILGTSLLLREDRSPARVP